MSIKLYSVLLLGLICGIIITLAIKNFIKLNNHKIFPIESLADGILHAATTQNHSTTTHHKGSSTIFHVTENISHNNSKSHNESTVRKGNLTVTPSLRRVSAEQTTSISTKSKTVSSHCKYKFRVYVYPIPMNLRAIQASEEARRNGTLHICQKCIFEQFALEYIVYDFFTKFCGRTNNPEEADYFYLPLVRDAEYRWALDQRLKNSRTPSDAEKALITVLEKNKTTLWRSVFNVTDYYWHRKQGADHILVMPAPVTNFRHEGSKRGFFHYMMHLYPPIFLGLEYSKSFVDEYPVCSKQKNIMMPYPTTDPDLFNGKFFSSNNAAVAAATAPRNYLLYYAGGLHGDCIEVRRAMQRLMQNSSRLSSQVVPRVPAGQAKREHGFLVSTFCPVPVGDSPSSKRMYDVLNFGCIPVVLSDDLVWAYSDQTGGPLNHSHFALQLPQSVIQYTMERTLHHYALDRSGFGRLPVSGLDLYDLLQIANNTAAHYEDSIYVNPLVHILRRIPQSDIDYLRFHGQQAAAKYRYYAMNVSMHRIPTAHHLLPDGEGIDMLALALEKRLTVGVKQVHESCLHERLKIKHKYVARYSCDTNLSQALHRRRRRRR